MSVRRDTQNRLTLHRTCHTCGRGFVTTAASPFVRQIANVDGRKQKTCYFCSESCKNKSYRHLFDGKAEERKKQKERERNVSGKNRAYYAEHAERLKAIQKKRYWSDSQEYRARNRYSKQKRAVLMGTN